MNPIKTVEYKTIAQIEADLKGNQSVRYPRTLDYVREMALTQFIRDIESQNEDFKLKSAHPQFIVRREMPKALPVFSIGLWATFSIGEVTFKFSIDSNVFFAVSIGKSMRCDSNTVLAEYFDDTNFMNIAYCNWDCSTDDKAIALLTENFHAAFCAAQKNKTNWIKRKIPVSACTEEQKIYQY